MIKQEIKSFFHLALQGLIVLVLISFIVTNPIYSVECRSDLNLKNKTEEELKQIMEVCEKKLNVSREKINTLSSEIQFMDTRIYFTTLKIKNTERSIKKTEEEIDVLSSRIEGLDSSLDYLSSLLLERVIESYKRRPLSMMMLLLDSNTASEFLTQFKYLKTAQKNNQKLLIQVQETKLNFEEQKKIREEKKKELDTLKITLDEQKKALDNQKLAKNRLLQVTKNNEKSYQSLLAKAKQQLESFKAFVKSAGGGTISANAFGLGKEGWYMSQRDERWANRFIGISNMNIREVGCLVTDIAMIYKRYGIDTTPLEIASQLNRFFGNTALMLVPWIGPNGRSYRSISKDQIDSELENGDPVIVGLKAGKYGTHFVVISKKEGNDYIIYDPYYGPDLKLSSRYSFDSIYKAVVFK